MKRTGRYNEDVPGLEAENARLRAALGKATEKLQIYRAASDGKYVGGMEYGAGMLELDRLHAELCATYRADLAEQQEPAHATSE